ncbi:MAG: hypothetical protein AVDCRST_MAG19-1192, partial [uncultured Thermomicrobiales bacterium]
ASAPRCSGLGLATARYPSRSFPRELLPRPRFVRARRTRRRAQPRAGRSLREPRSVRRLPRRLRRVPRSSRFPVRPPDQSGGESPSRLRGRDRLSPRSAPAHQPVSHGSVAPAGDTGDGRNREIRPAVSRGRAGSARIRKGERPMETDAFYLDGDDPDAVERTM